MTYFGFLLRFLVIPILILLFITWREKERPTPGFRKSLIRVGILVHVVLAVLYTTPWDNYLVATGVWYYNPDLVTGIVLGYVPIEEYTFFVLETILSGLWWWFLARRIPEPSAPIPKNGGKIRWTAVSILLAIWLVSVYLFFWGADSWNYLSITLMWALPAILPQLIFGADLLWHYRRLVFMTIFVPGTYLSLMDIVALTDTTWSISPGQTTGVLFFGILPLEEVVFFFITNVLIGFGLTLMLSEAGQVRVQAWKAKLFPGDKTKHANSEAIR
jgi:lycopene beta-cyclase